MSSERVLLIGLGPTTLSALEALAERFDVVGLVRGLPEDKTVGRARELGVPVYADTKPAALEALVLQLQPDAVVVSSYDRILPGRMLEGRPFVNVHYAPLPRYRGRATVNWALINGEPTAAISVHTLVAGLDAGGILYQGEVPIGERATVTELYEQLNDLQHANLADAVQRRLEGDEGGAQDESHATYACTRVPGDGEIDWSQPTVAIDRLIRALTDPFPGAFTFLDARRLWIRKAEPVPDPPRYEGRIPGRIVGRSRTEGWADVLTGDATLRLWLVQRDGHPIQPASEVITSVKATLGLGLSDLLDRLGGSP